MITPALLSVLNDQLLRCPLLPLLTNPHRRPCMVLKAFDNPMTPPSLPPTLSLTSTLYFTADHVRRQLMCLHSNKAASPDGVSPKVPNACTLQLCGVLQHVFNMSLNLPRILIMWKTSCLIPVPKTFTSQRLLGLQTSGIDLLSLIRSSLPTNPKCVLRMPSFLC